MLHFSEEDHVSLMNKFPAPRLRHKVYAFGRSAREDDLIGTGRADIARNGFP